MSFSKGSVVALIRKLDGDWYEVSSCLCTMIIAQCSCGFASFQGKVDGKVGLVPGNYLEIIEPLSSEDDGSSSEVESTVAM